MVSDSKLDEIAVCFNSILEDASIPKNLKLKIGDAVEILNSEHEISLKISKVLAELEEISGDMNLTPHLRTQVWNIISSLENVLTLV